MYKNFNDQQQHFCYNTRLKLYIHRKEDSKWYSGPFLGIVMKGRDDSIIDRHEDTNFASITITRASCKHTHNLWGALYENKGADKVVK